MKQPNKWEQLFEQFMDLMEFSLIKHKNPQLVLSYKDPDGNLIEEVHEGVWSIYDRQGANLGDINEDRFSNAEQIFERMDIYINDYLIENLESLFYESDVDLPNPYNCWEDLLKSRNKFGSDCQWDFDVLDMICNHANEIDLNKVYYEEKE